MACVYCKEAAFYKSVAVRYSSVYADPGQILSFSIHPSKAWGLQFLVSVYHTVNPQLVTARWSPHLHRILSAQNVTFQERGVFSFYLGTILYRRL